MKIVDRTKNLFKLSQGEYIAPEKVEQTYLSCNLIQQIYVEGNSLKSYAVAIVKPDFKQLREQAANIISHLEKEKPDRQTDQVDLDKKQRNEVTNAELCTKKEIRAYILDQMNKIAREKGLKGFELVSLIYFIFVYS
ncbi:unnamed protein product [Trichobilharzia regenti]|nr:unnamed protein product [Trichobilharzia regenti]